MSDNTFSGKMAGIFDDYISKTGDSTPELKSVAAWAINNGLYDIPFADKISQFCRELRGALRTQTHKTKSGRTMRTYQCVRRPVSTDDGKTEQQFLWSDIRKAEPAFVLQAFRERHRASRGDVRALQTDVCAWNESYRPSDFPPIEFDWDFSVMQGDEG